MTELLELFDVRMRQQARPDGPGVTVERAGGVVRQRGSAQDWNGILWSDLDERTADAAIAAQIRDFAGPFEWKLYTHDRPGDLADRLRAAGFIAEEPETLMIARVADLPTAADLPEGVRLHQVTDAAGVDRMMDVHAQAFGTSPGHLRHQLLARLAEAPDTLVAAVAMAGDLPVSAARMELHPGTGFAGLWSGGTVPGWRGRGLYRALVAHRTRIAAERGYRYLQVDASDQSRPILQRLGFTPLTTTIPFLYQPA